MQRLPFSHLVCAALVSGLVLGGCASTTTSATAGEDAVLTTAAIAELEAKRAPAAAFATGLSSPQAAVRARAMLALARLERLDAVAAIAGALGDVDAAVRANAAFAAGQVDLALSTSPADLQVRDSLEGALVQRLSSEQAATVRIAVVRALGRIASGVGLHELVDVAGRAGPLRAEALAALGVAGQRRGGSLVDDVDLQQAVRSGLADPDPATRTGAAYAAFRQGVALDDADLQHMAGAPEQARIHFARALAGKRTPVAVVNGGVATLLQDTDWRVQVEALRAVRAHSDAALGPVLQLLPAAAQRIAAAGQAHVVSEACSTLAVVGAASVSLPVVEQAVAALPPGPTWAVARCTCAGVVEVLGGPGDALEQCTTALPERTQRLLSIDTIARARISSTERAAALKGFFGSDEPKIRIAAANALCADDSLAAGDAAATQLVTEADSGVMSALLECFAGGNHGDVLKDRTLSVAAARLVGRSGFEQLEPLITIATIARSRPASATMQSLVDELSAHSDPAVRDAAMGVTAGARAPGPRAVVLPAPVTATLPLAAVLRTTRGEIVIAFDRELAPRTVKTFVELATKGVLNNTPFHRVVADFVSQGGDPRGDGSGGPGFTIPCENSDARFTRGAVGMAHAGKDTGGSQFFLTHSEQPHLDGRYTFFATITDGLAVMDSLQRDDVLLSVDFTTALRRRNGADNQGQP